MPFKLYLLTSKVLEKTNNSSIAQFVNNSLKLLWPRGSNVNKVLLMLFDAVPYMIKAAQNLKPICLNFVHVACVAHGIHQLNCLKKILFMRLMISIKKCIGIRLIINRKKVFFKISRIQLYNKKLSNILTPSRPIITR